jgi:hypothetical protein
LDLSTGTDLDKTGAEIAHPDLSEASSACAALCHPDEASIASGWKDLGQLRAAKPVPVLKSRSAPHLQLPKKFKDELFILTFDRPPCFDHAWSTDTMPQIRAFAESPRRDSSSAGRCSRFAQNKI